MEWSEFIGKDIPDKDPVGLLKETKGVLVTDARSLFDVIQKGPQSITGYGLKEKYSVLDMMSVFQRLQKAGTQSQDGCTVTLKSPTVLQNTKPIHRS